ncbi:MAG: hypothetical protein JOZ62_15190, partial [Acidobacteriaceae bacterium]|nr:hypothetical protein [Acidobacteriaceae bacterium]
QHRSHDTIYAPGPDTLRAPGKAPIFTRAPGLVAKLAAQLPGIDRKAYDVERHFKTVSAMMSASEKDWQEIPGIGKQTAKQVVEILRR